MRRVAIAVVIALAGCGPTEPAPSGSCGREPWIDPGDPLAIPARARGAVAWEAGAGGEPIVIEGTLARVEAGATTNIVVEVTGSEVVLEIDLPTERLGVLPTGEPVRVTLGDGIVIANAEGRLRTAIVSRRDATEASAGELTFRQVYAECVLTRAEDACTAAMASPLVDVVSGASIVRIPPGGVWRIPDDVDPSVEIEIVRSVRAPEDGELEDAGAPSCPELPAREIAALVRHLR